MSVENYVAEEILTPDKLNQSFANNIAKTGDVVTGGLEITGWQVAAYGATPGSQTGIHIYSNTLGTNYTPVYIELSPVSDRRNSGNYIALSSFLSVANLVDLAGGNPPGMNIQSQIHAFEVNSATSNVNNTNGITNITANLTQKLPTQYASVAAATSAYYAQPSGSRNTLSPVTLENWYSTTDTADNVMLVSSIFGPLAMAEHDMQVNCIDDAGTRGGWALNGDQKQRTQSGGYHASASFGYYVDGLAGFFWGVGYRTGANVLVSLSSLDTVINFNAVVTNPQTTASQFAPSGTPAPAAAPTPPSGGDVVHIDSPSPVVYSSNFPGYQGGYQGGGIGPFQIGGNSGDGGVSAGNPVYATASGTGATYLVVSAQPDGPGWESGYIVTSSAIASADKALGVTWTRVHYTVAMRAGQRYGYNDSGTAWSAYSSAINNNNGGVNFSTPLRVNTVLELGGGSAAAPAVTFLNFNFWANSSSATGITFNPFNVSYAILINGVTALTLNGSGAVTLKSTGSLIIGSDQVVGARQTGWTAGTGTTNTPNKAAMNYDTATLAQLASRVFALEQALFAATGHGLIGAT